MSLARKHKARVQQKQATQQKVKFDPVLNSVARSVKKTLGPLPEALQKLKDGFEGDRQTLKLLNGDQQRLPFKKELIEKYHPLCEYFICHYDDWARLDCLFWWLMWRSDIENFIDVEPDLYKAVQHGLTTPTQFERDWQTVYSDLVFLYSDENLKIEKEDGHEWNTNPLVKLVSDITNGDIILNVPLKAKIYAAYGKVTMRLGQTKLAVKAFKMALDLNEKVGVKKLLIECEAELLSAESDTDKSGEDNE